LLEETNITPWRRAVVGDLTSAFDFEKPNAGHIQLPGTEALRPQQFVFYPDFNVVAPANQALPKQESGVRPARALPYSLHAHGLIDASGAAFQIEFVNTGRATGVFHVRSGSDAHIPRSYTVEPNKSLSGSWNLGAIGVADCNLTVHGPNGFLRAFKGSVAALRRAQLDVRTDYDEKNADLTLVIRNLSTQPATVFVFDNYKGKSIELPVQAGATVFDRRSLSRESGWYGLVIAVEAEPSIGYHLAGHVENGKPSISDPALGAF
jgi:phospholipase C